jgi:streptogrisin C
MRSKSIIVAGLAAITLTPLVIISTPAVADPSDKPTTVTVGQAATLESVIVAGTAKAGSLTDAETQDLQALAKSKGQSVADLARRYRDRESFDSLTTALAQSPTYVQAGYVTDSDDAEVWIRFTRRPDQAVLDKIAGELSYKVRIEYGSRLGWDELNTTMERLFLLTDSQPGVADAGASIDPNTDSITITYTGPDQSLPSATVLADAVMKTAAADPLVAVSSRQVQVTFTKSEDETTSATEATVRGGYSLSTDTVEADCTSGIPISQGGQSGLATAMHCPNGLRYGGVNDTGIIQYRNAASTTSSGAHIDLQWHSTLSGNSTSASFYVAPSTIRSVNAANNAVVNDYVCHYGLGSYMETGNGYGCDYVYQLAVCYTPEDLEFCGLAALDSHITTFGDSGGPWFNGNTMKGVHSGFKPIGGVERALYTPQTRIAENLDGSVLTS